jgi:hypothetical protein
MYGREPSSGEASRRRTDALTVKDAESGCYADAKGD